jgi:hypothetical protein
VKKDLKRTTIFFFIFLVGLIFYWITPHVYYVIFINIGGNQIERILITTDYTKSGLPVCGLPVNFNSDQKELLNSAKRNYEKARKWVSQSSYIYLLLGRVNCLLGDYDSAIDSLKVYSEKKPLNKIGYIESGFANEKNSNITEAVNQWNEAGLSYIDFTNNGDDFRMDFKFEESKIWYKRGEAMLGKPLDDFGKIDSDSINILESFASTRNLYAYPNNTIGIMGSDDGILTMSYQNDLEKRDFFTYQFNIKNFLLNENNELVIRLKGNYQTYLTIETVVKEERYRPVSYTIVPDEWSIWFIPLEHGELSNITIGISEPDNTITNQKYEIQIDWIGVNGN